MGYKVKIQQFEGPFDLLVYLIEHAKMSIYDIKVSEITSQYLDYISELKRQDVSVAQEFMVLAAELIQLKSEMLLPKREDEELASCEDPRKELVARILEYKRFKAVAALLAQKEEEGSHIHVKPKEDISVYASEPEESIYSSTEQFVSAFRGFIFKKQRMAEMHRQYERLERNRMSIEDRISQIMGLFGKRKKKKMMFSEMVERDPSRYGTVLTFVSLLELLKQRAVSAKQKKRFSDIEVSLISGGENGKS
ncbi:MAG TPA: segregation/condensation protein A [Bacillota bacterium]|nr:segregation/condensation protein A [Bacillota bacterium]